MPTIPTGKLLKVHKHCTQIVYQIVRQSPPSLSVELLCPLKWERALIDSVAEVSAAANCRWKAGGSCALAWKKSC